MPWDLRASVNPLGLSTLPFTSPVGWFDGVDVSPNGGVRTVNSVSPVGCYDMSGQVSEWVHDWYGPNYYNAGGPPWENPTGPALNAGVGRVLRGGSWWFPEFDARTANRAAVAPDGSNMLLFTVGFRVAKS
jgi:formylglycine-generating enzyme required for sulfatase activity